MARAQAREWLRLGAGLLIGLAGPLLPISAQQGSLDEQRPVARVRGASDARMALNQAIEKQRRGDYEAVEPLIRTALAGQKVLTPTEQNELAQLVKDNQEALHARRMGLEQLSQAESELDAGSNERAHQRLRMLAGIEQYLSQQDRARLARMLRQSMGVSQPTVRAAEPASKPSPKPTPKTASAKPSGRKGNPVMEAYRKVQAARAELARYNFEKAEQLAREADRMGVRFRRPQDSPKALLEAIQHSKSDPKILLSASRVALRQKQYDRAEHLAKQADKLGSWTFTIWGDKPSKVLADVQQARAEMRKQAEGPVLTPKKGTPTKPTPAKTVTAKGDPTDRARSLLKQGRSALRKGDIKAARSLAEQAQALKPRLRWYDDNPTKLLAAVQAQEARAPKPTNPKAKTQTASSKRMSKAQASSLLAKGRQQLEAGRLDEAHQIALQLKAAHWLSWGLFGDNPDRFKLDVQKTRIKHDQAESVKVLAQGRKYLAEGKLQEAMQAAYRAQKLHGPYNLRDLGDRPANLLEDIETAQRDLRRRQTAVVKQTKPTPKTMPTPEPKPTEGSEVRQVSASTSEQEKARQWLNAARLYIRRGDMAKAREIADYVKKSKVALGPKDDSPEKIYAEIDRIARVEGAIKSAQSKASESEKKLEEARKILSEARELQKKGHLLGARRKVVEAQKIGAKFPPKEDTPALVLMELAGTARKFIEGHTQAAVDVVERGTGDRTKRLAEAEKRLTYARHLAKEYGQDDTVVVAKLSWLEREKQPRPVQPTPMPSPTPTKLAVAAVPPVAPTPPTTPIGLPVKPGLPTLPVTLPGNPTTTAQVPTPKPTVNPGKQYLDKARLELRAGNLSTARKLAEDALKGEHGVKEEALAVIRSIDTEQYNQKCRQACRTFDSAMGAYRRREYPFASSMMATIDARLLDPQRRGRLREILMTPEMAQAMRPTTDVAQTGATQPTPATPSPSPTGSTPPGMARATDQGSVTNPDTTLIDTVKAMRRVKFQALQTKGLQKLKLASEKFRTGQTDDAIRLLEDHLAMISETDLESHEMLLLKRPVSSRMSQFKLLKAQQDWLVKSERDRKENKTNRGQRFLAKENQQEQVSKLMREFNDRYREGKYLEAERAVMQARELDPDNAVVSASAIMVVRRRRLAASDKMKADKDEFSTTVLLEAENFADNTLGAAKGGVQFPDDWNTTRDREDKSTSYLTKRTSTEQEIERLLDAPVTLNFTNEPMYRALDYIRAWHGLNIDIDDAALGQEGIDLSRPITIKVENIALRSALNLLLEKIRLTWVIRNDVLQVTTKSQARGKLTRATHQVADLVIPVNDFGTLDPNAQQSRSPLVTTRPMAYGSNTGPSPTMDPYSMSGGSPVGSPGGVGPFGSGTGPGGVSIQRAQTKEDVLIKLITNTIAPESWRDMGGPGQIDFFPLTMSLVINQTPDIQEQIADLLQALRRLQDQEVAVEVRFVLVAEEFYERIGVNFQMNILQDNARFEPQLTSGVFAPAGFVNSFRPNRFLTGLTPAGTFTQDLNIPITNNTFFQAIPPFGSYQQGVGGITTGLAFLSDIQVFMFLEAVQSDRRTNVMQAPRLTMFNGQTATLQVSDDSFFVTGVGIQQVPGTGQFAFVPQITPLPINATIVSIQSVISADRRFVRLSLNQNFFSQVPGPVTANAFPITVPIFTAAGTNGFVSASDPIVFTQFIQQPRISTISVGTTVMVPDGGTVLLGGLKRLSEGRTELGPPILSKIPKINRLFKNVGYGRESASLLIMVTPRIIIQEEEEFRQTGFRSNPLLGTGQDVIPELGN